MKKFLIILIVLGGVLLLLKGMPQRLSTDSSLDREIVASRMLTSPLPLDSARSLEAEQLSRTPLQTETLPLGTDSSGWYHEGYGRISFMPEDTSLCLFIPVSTGKRARGSADDPDYATFGRAAMRLNLHGRDLRPFNRIVMEVKPECQGTMIMNLNAVLRNVRANELGAHLINLSPNKWNKVVFGIEGVRRDSVLSLSLYTDLKGRNGALCDSVSYRIRNLCLERVGEQEKESGWDVPQGYIAYSSSGYLLHGQKTAVVSNTQGGSFLLLDEKSSKVRFKGEVKPIKTKTGRFGLMDFSSFNKPGSYRLRLNGTNTKPFLISDDAFLNAQWRLLNFIFCQRCGYEVAGIHGVCHQDLFCDHAGRQICYGGGWHDAGDLSQQTLQTAEVAHALIEAYLHNKTIHPVLAERMLEEAEWGLRFILRCRFGDGFRASSMGLLHWTDSKPGTPDDIHTVRKQDNAFDNFLYAAFEAFAAQSLPPSPLCDSLSRAAVEDFRFAEEKFRQNGYERFPHLMEHTYNTSPSLFQAARSWSATQLFHLTDQIKYAQVAAEGGRYIVSCQEKDVFSGYFHRDSTRRVPLHFIHQSREHLMMQALVALCQTQPSHPDAGLWQEAVRCYGDYLKRLMTYTEPFGMMPSGIWQAGEYDNDEEGFRTLHLFAPQNARERFDLQLHNGVKIDETHYLRRFPMSFSIFNGNEAIILSTGKGAAICGSFLGDEALRQAGLEQLYWTVGKNPFCQSLIYGEGHRYPSMDSFSSGEITGEIPVGIRSLGDEDVPYWPQTNNACYKEVWLTSAGRALSLLSEY